MKQPQDTRFLGAISGDFACRAALLTFVLLADFFFFLVSFRGFLKHVLFVDFCILIFSSSEFPRSRFEVRCAAGEKGGGCSLILYLEKGSSRVYALLLSLQSSQHLSSLLPSTQTHTQTPSHTPNSHTHTLSSRTASEYAQKRFHTQQASLNSDTRLSRVSDSPKQYHHQQKRTHAPLPCSRARAKHPPAHTRATRGPRRHESAPGSMEKRNARTVRRKPHLSFLRPAIADPFPSPRSSTLTPTPSPSSASATLASPAHTKKN